MRKKLIVISLLGIAGIGGYFGFKYLKKRYDAKKKTEADEKRSAEMAAQKRKLYPTGGKMQSLDAVIASGSSTPNTFGGPLKV